MPEPSPTIAVIDLGRMPYIAAYEEQCRVHEAVLAARANREAGEAAGPPGVILLVEHDPPVITVSKREGARRNLVATPGQLLAAGVEVVETDRGGDITYHGPGQLVAYPIIDLNHFRLGLHDYMRLLEDSVIESLAEFGIAGERDAGATGVWVRTGDGGEVGRLAKVCAMGVRVRKWVSMHGLALNVSTTLEHFGLIVPCGLVGRSVTSMDALLAPRAMAGMDHMKRAVADALVRRLSVRSKA